jgi:hypothetical protein
MNGLFKLCELWRDYITNYIIALSDTIPKYNKIAHDEQLNKPYN